MNTPQRIFLADSNVFITPFNQFYPFDFAINYWNFLKNKISARKIVILNKIFYEISSQEDSLYEWISKFEDLIIDNTAKNISSSYQSVIEYIAKSEKYNDKALRKWSDNTKADAWLVAAAMANKSVIVSLELPQRSLGTNPASNAKIPDVAKHFNIECINLYEMLRRLNFRF
jgi:hypothetical protein